MSAAFEELTGLLARLRGLFAGLDPYEDALAAAVPGLRESWGLSGLAVYRTSEREGDRARVRCLAAVGSLAHLPVDRAIGNDQLDGVVIGVQGRFLDGLVLPTDSSPEQRDLAGVVGLALDDELQGRATEQSLQERVKELRTLREVQVAIQEDLSLGDLVHRIVRVLPSGLQFPRVARADLEVDERRATAGMDGVERHGL